MVIYINALNPDKKKIVRCPKLNYSWPEDDRKRQGEVNQLTATKPTKDPHTPECPLGL